MNYQFLPVFLFSQRCNEKYLPLLMSQINRQNTFHWLSLKSKISTQLLGVKLCFPLIFIPSYWSCTNLRILHLLSLYSWPHNCDTDWNSGQATAVYRSTSTLSSHQGTERRRGAEFRLGIRRSFRSSFRFQSNRRESCRNWSGGCVQDAVELLFDVDVWRLE